MNNQSISGLLIGIALSLGLHASGNAPEVGGPFFSNQPGATFTAYFQIDHLQRTGKLFVEATIPEGMSIFSMTQPQPGPIPFKLTPKSNEVLLTGRFTPSAAPHVEYVEELDWLIEDHREDVTWSAPIEIPEGVDPMDLKIDIKLRGQFNRPTDATCGLIRKTLTASFASQTMPLTLVAARSARNSSERNGLKQAGRWAVCRGSLRDPTRIGMLR